MITNEKRLDHIIRFYNSLDTLKEKIKGFKTLGDLSIGSSWFTRGVYFFFEEGEVRSDSGMGPRVVHIGTHALRENGNTTLWDRLQNHKGSEKSGGGNHRSSPIRKYIGQAHLERHKEHRMERASWGEGTYAPWDIRLQEHDLEVTVSSYIRKMPFLYLAVEDEPSPYSQRAYITRNTIALLSNYDKEPIDPPSDHWLGNYVESRSDRIRKAGLWNISYVDKEYDPFVLLTIDMLIKRM